jgi:outer membrane protein assembly factor BamB
LQTFARDRSRAWIPLIRRDEERNHPTSGGKSGMKKIALSLLMGGVAAASFAQTTTPPQNVLVLGSHVLKQGGNTVVEIDLLNPTNVAGAQARLLYDPKVVTPVENAGGENVGSIISGFGAVNYETGVAPDANGLKGIFFAIAGSAGATTSGKVLTLTFKPADGAAVNASSTFKMDPDPTQYVLSDQNSNPIANAGFRTGALIVGSATAGWSRLFPSGISGSVTADGAGGVWVVSDDGTLHALNAADGTDKSGVTAAALGASVMGRPVAKEGAVIAATSAGKVFSVNPANGSMTSGWPAAGTDLGAGAANFTIRSTPAVANSQVYVTDSNDAITALDLATGAVKAGPTPISTGAAANTQGFSSPAVPGPNVPGVGAIGSVWVGGADNNVHQFNGADLTPLKTVPTGGAVQGSPFIDTASGLGYVGSGDGHVYVFNAGTGDAVGNYDTGGPVQNSLYTTGPNAIGVNNAGTLFTVSSTGGAVSGSNPSSAKFSGGASYAQSPIVLGNVLWIGDVNGMIHTANVDGSGIKDIVAGGTPVTSPAVVAAGTVAFGVNDGSVIALPTQ